MKKTLVFALILLCALFSFSCGGSVTELSAKSPESKVALGATVDLNDYYDKTGEGKIDFSVSPADVLVPGKKGWVAAKEGECVVTAYAGDLTASFTLRVVDDKKIPLSLIDETFVYDGSVKNLSLDRTLPAGSTVEYRCGGEPFSGAVEPGEYEVSVEVTLPRGYTAEYVKKTALLTIRKKTFVIDDLRFRSAYTTYDGEEKSLSVEGDLPEGTRVDVRYFDLDGNEVSHVYDAGVYDAKAYFIVDERYYEEPPVMAARLTVEKKELVDGDLDAEYTYVYDGREHFPELTLPQGLSATYFVLTSGGYVERAEYLSAEPRAFIDSGRRVVRAELTLDEDMKKNYSAPTSARLTVKIDRADFVSDLKWREGEVTYRGAPYTLGYGEYDLGLYGDLPRGVGGEFPDGVQVKFFSGGVQADVHEFLDAGKYTVVAKFSVPEESIKNYNALPDLSFTVNIKKAPYKKSFSFDPIDQYGVDLSQGIVYDGNVHKFSLRFPNEQEEETFLADCELSYYTINERGTRTNFTKEAAVLDAGRYTVGYEISFKDPVLQKNFILPENGSFEVVVNKVVFDMSEVWYLPDSVVYDGLAHTVLPVGVPDGVSYRVTGGDVTDAGTYSLRVDFFPTDLPATNCALVGREGTIVNGLRTTLTITKATYSAEDIPAASTAEAVYSPTATLSDRAVLLDGEETSLVRWQDPTIRPTCDREKYYAVYNADEKNFVGYVFLVDVVTTPVTLDGALFAAYEQFLPYDGKSLAPTLYYDGDVADPAACLIEYVCDEDATAIGTHTLTDVTVSLRDETNYRLIGDRSLDDLVVHVYDGGLFSYSGSMLEKYLGRQTSVTVPDGTTEIKREAFVSTGVVRLTLPDSLLSASRSALVGMSSLQSLTLPFVGAERGGALSDLFGTEGLPATLTEVTVTDEDTVPAYAFRNDSSLRSVTYLLPVREVGERAFEGCGSLLALSFPDIERLGENAFYKCYSLERLTIPFIGESSFTGTATYLFGDDLGDNAFKNYALSLIDLTSGDFAEVPSSAFAGMKGLEEIFLPATARRFEYGAFRGTGARVHLPTDLATLDEGAFFGYEGTEVTLPETLTAIGDGAFRGASSILIIYIPQKVTSVGENAFFGVKADLRFAEGSELTRVGKRAFAGYLGASVALPSGVLDLDDYAFEGSGIVAVDTAATLGKCVFKDCLSLAEAALSSEVLPEGTFSGCASLAAVSLPNVTVVGLEAFSGCESLRSITLPSGLLSVGRYAFSGCDGIGFITMRSSAVPSIDSSALPDQTFTLYVPESSVTAYAVALEEKGYRNVNVRPLP